MVCENKSTALSLLESVTIHLSDGKKRAAIEEVAGWIERSVYDIPDDPKERRDLITRIEKELRDCMTEDDRRKLALFYLEGLDDKELSPEAAARIKKIYDDAMDEGNIKFIEWQAHGGVPEHGTRIEVPYLFDAEKKIWEPEHGLPPTWTEEHFLPKQELGENETR
jgi:hypothetical protein